MQMSYSPFFNTLHDETAPVGDLGRGTHYSVMRAITWHDAQLRVLPKASALDFAIIWDEDHDTRVVALVEKMYFEGLLAPVRFVGERKGMFTVLIDPATPLGRDRAALEAYVKHVEGVAEGDGGDSWRPLSRSSVRAIQPSSAMRKRR